MFFHTTKIGYFHSFPDRLFFCAGCWRIDIYIYIYTDISVYMYILYVLLHVWSDIICWQSLVLRSLAELMNTNSWLKCQTLQRQQLYNTFSSWCSKTQPFLHELKPTLSHQAGKTISWNNNWNFPHVLRTNDTRLFWPIPGTYCKRPKFRASPWIFIFNMWV